MNRLIYSLDQDVQAVVKTDVQGNINIVLNAIDVSLLIIYVQCPMFAEILNIYANRKINHHLQALTSSGGLLKDATNQDRKPVLDSLVTTDTANSVTT